MRARCGHGAVLAQSTHGAGATMRSASGPSCDAPLAQTAVLTFHVLCKRYRQCLLSNMIPARRGRPRLEIDVFKVQDLLNQKWTVQEMAEQFQVHQPCL